MHLRNGIAFLEAQNESRQQESCKVKEITVLWV